MKRYDLRHLKGDCLDKMQEIMQELPNLQAAIFIYEMGDFSIVQKSAELANSLDCAIVNSLRYNQVDWTMCVKKEVK